MKKIHGGEIVALMLAAEGVEKVFGIIDGTYFGLSSNLEKHGIELITPRHEASAAHMAGAYAGRRTGTIGIRGTRSGVRASACCCLPPPCPDDQQGVLVGDVAAPDQGQQLVQLGGVRTLLG